MHLAAVFLVSIAVLAGQLGLIRYFSATGYANFAAMLISIALLGFGLSGTLLTVFRKRIERRLDDWLFAAAAGFTLLAGTCFLLAREIRFIPQNLHQDGGQLLNLGLYYLLFLLPFFAGALFINLSFVKMKQAINRLYFFNMLGSGVGALLLVVLMSLFPPQYLVVPSILLAGTALILQALASGGRRRLVFAAGLTVLALLPFAGGLKLEFSEFKSISYAQKVPDTRVVGEASTPLGYLQVLESEQFRFAPGLSLSFYEITPPVQLGLFSDGNAASGIARRYKDPADLAYVRNLPFSIPFWLRERPSVLLLGVGGGNPVLFAGELGASRITAVEPNQPLYELIRERFADYTRGLWDDPRLSVEIGDGRSFCKRSDGRWDVIAIEAMLSSGMSFNSGTGNGENYLFTREALDDYLARLEPDGLLYISMQMASPPRTLLKLLTLAFSGLRERHPHDFAGRLVFLRGLDWGVLLVKNGVFTDTELATIRRNAGEFGFDLSWFPGIRPEDTNIHNLIDEELYYRLAQAFVSGNEREFLDGYFFDIGAPDDDRPFFDQYLRFSTVTRLFGLDGGLEEIPFSEWGYLLLWATLLQGLLFSLLIIAIPLFTSGRRFLKERGKTRIIAYFFALGAGYMLIEMAVIQKLTLLVANPLYSVALVISVLLIASGLGARFAGRFTGRPLVGIRTGVLGIVAGLLFYILVFSPLFPTLLGLPEMLRILAVVLVLGPLGFFMGFPFPLGLQVLSDRKEVFMTWGLAINGSVSVFATVLTSILAIHLGFTLVFLLAAGCYGLAWASFPGRIRFTA